MKIALAQVSSHIDPDANLALIESVAQEAKDLGAELVLFPEATHRNLQDPSTAPTIFDVAEPRNGAWSRRVKEMALKIGIVIVVGMYTTTQGSASQNQRVRNTLLAVGPELENDVFYDKIHLYDAFGYKESELVEPGIKPKLFTLNGITFGLATCYDLRFPQLFQHYAKAGATAVLLAASWASGESKIQQWETLVTARALDSTCYVIACDQADPTSTGALSMAGVPSGIGFSKAVGPEGDEIASAGPNTELLIAEMSTQRAKQARESIPVITNAVDW